MLLGKWHCLCIYWCTTSESLTVCLYIKAAQCSEINSKKAFQSMNIVCFHRQLPRAKKICLFKRVLDRWYAWALVPFFFLNLIQRLFNPKICIYIFQILTSCKRLLGSWENNGKILGINNWQRGQEFVTSLSHKWQPNAGCKNPRKKRLKAFRDSIFMK